MFIELSDREREMVIEGLNDRIARCLNNALETGGFAKRTEWLRQADEYMALLEKL